ncbi:MAG: hypothetical protein K1X89_31255, partial [Myxococcaceae bacterium]|nr:hypothetical protein [Myxococcaceae bacterium]
GGGSAVARPGRTVTSDDQRAVLWIPDGGAPADVNITVTAVDGGYRLGPSGLVFERAALLYFRTTPNGLGDGGLGFINASLVLDDGGVQPARAFRTAAVGHAGRELGLGVVEIPHFSGVIVQSVPEGALPAQGVEVLMEPEPRSQSFDRVVGDPPWRARLILARGEMPYFAGQYVVAASGSVEVPAGQAVDVGLPRPVDLTTAQLESADFDVRCKEKGPGTLTATVFTNDFSRALSVAYSGMCREKAVAAAIEPARVEPPSSPAVGAQALAAATTKVVQAAKPEVAPMELGQPIPALVQDLNTKKDVPSGITATWSLPCVTECPLGVEFLAKVTVSNMAGSEALAKGLFVANQTPVFTVSPVVGGTFGVKPGANGVLLEGRDVPNGGTTDLVFNYRCVKDGTDTVRGYLTLKWDYQSPPPGYGYADYYQGALLDLRSPVVKCGKGGDAIMLSDNAKVTRTDAGYTAAAPGVTANLIHAAPAVQDHFFPIGKGTNLYTGVAAFTSNQGLSPLVVKSARQNATATFNGSRYVFSGLVGGAAFNATDALTVEHTPAGMPTLSVTVPAPPPLADLNAFFGPRQGLKTEVHIPDGTFDTFFVSVVGGPPGGPAGQSGVLRLVQAADMTLVGADRVAPLLDDEALATLSDLGWTVQTLYVAYYRQQDTQLFFPSLRALPVQAGRMFQVNAADLAP